MENKEIKNTQEDKSLFPAREEEILNFWEKNKIFEKSVENPPHPPFRKGVERIMFSMMGRLLARANRIMGIFYPAYPRM